MEEKYQQLLHWIKLELLEMNNHPKLKNYYQITINKNNSEIWTFRDDLNHYEILNLAYDILTIQGYQYKAIKYENNQWIIKGFNDYQSYLKYIKKVNNL